MDAQRGNGGISHARIDHTIDHTGRPDHPDFYRSERVSGAKGGADLCHVNPGGSDFDDYFADVAGRDDPGKQYRANHRECGWHPISDYLRPAGAGYPWLLAGLSVPDHSGSMRNRWHPWRHVLGSAAPRFGHGIRPSLSRGQSRRRSTDSRFLRRVGVRGK